MTTFIVFFIVLSVLVLVHEWGHFITARKAGAKVEEFGLGFPPRLFGVKKNGVLYSFNIIPFGGFVKIYGEEASDIKEPGSFGSLSIARRALTLVAGVAMNFILAVVLFSIISFLGIPTAVDETSKIIPADAQVQILEVEEGSPAAEANLKRGDVVEKIIVGENEIAIDTVKGLQDTIRANRGGEIKVVVDRQGEVLTITATPRDAAPVDQGGLGILIAKIGTVSSPWWRAPWDGLKITLKLTGAIIVAMGRFFGNILIGNGLIADISGPVGIAVLSREAARLGIVYLMQFTAILSINLAILNILPFPALDGGRLVFLAIEKMRGGKPVKKEIESLLNTAGFFLLILLMVWITWKDIIRFF